jgi:hypothetical protein
VNTASARFSAINLSSPWRHSVPLPSGSFDQADRQQIPYHYTGILWAEFVEPPTPEVPIHGGAGGRARTYRYIGAREYELEKKIVRVLIEEEKPSGGVEYKEVEWQPDASWQALMAAIEAITVELGNFDGTLERSKLLRDELKRLKKKRNQRIILLAIE